MGKNLSVLSMLMLFAFQQSNACDACGCSASGGGIGLMSAYHYNYVGLQWHHAGFETASGHGNGAKDGFHTIELSIRYHITKKLKVLINQPYKWNLREVEGTKQSVRGISDTKIYANYTLLKNAKIGKKTKLYLEVAAGLKMPLGKFNEQIHDKDLPENFNVGNGSWGYLFQSNLILNRNKSGIVWTNNYQLNGSTKEGYTFGNQFSTQLLFFHEIKIKEELKITPKLGCYSEWVTDDTFANDNTVTGTGGTGLYLSAGFHIKKGDWLLGTSWSLPALQDYSQGEVNATRRFSCQLSYIF